MKKICKHCGIVYFKPMSTNKKYCSKKCYWEASKGKLAYNKGISLIKKKCIGCGIEFISRKPLNQIYCNKKCRNQYLMSKEKNPNWNGGISPLRSQLYSIEEYKQWRSDVFKRDNWTCQTCGVRGVYLEAHHIKELNKIIKENNIKTKEEALNCSELWDINNGVTLCQECHNLTKRGRGI